MKAVWPNTVVEENNLNQQISTLRKLFAEAAGEHRFIVTVPGQGYRFVQDVQRLASLPFTADRLPENSEPITRRGRFASRPVVVAAAALILMISASMYWVLARTSSPSMVAEPPSIVVLPFADVSPDHDQGYFADGLSEELLNALGKLNDLRVVGRTSSFAFKGKNEDVRQVAATLGVQHVLEGSVRRNGDRLRIAAQLVDATNGSQLWAQTYDRKLGDVFAIQKQIADSVADTLQLRLRPGRRDATAGGTRDVVAYDAYLSALAVTNDGGSARAKDAIALLEHAVQLDPNFARAWAALAEAYTFAVDFPLSDALSLAPLDLQQRISRAALRAFELAPDAPETLRSAGMVSMRNRDWAEAERRLHKAVELAGPYDYDANFHYAWFLINVGRTTEAIPYEERAMHAEPLLMRPVAFRAALYEMRGEADKAEALLTASTDLRGHPGMRKEALVMTYLARHDRSGLRHVLAENGSPCPLLDDPAEALDELRQSYDDAKAHGARVRLIPVAHFAAFLGDRDLSLDALRSLGPTQNVHAIWRPALSEVRKLPGFENLVRELGLVDYWRASGDWGEFCRESEDGGLTCS
jgi:TolB-like protein/Tfp pilus assembly protein PilF